jgi:hypothetical protein
MDSKTALKKAQALEEERRRKFDRWAEACRGTDQNEIERSFKEKLKAGREVDSAVLSAIKIRSKELDD